MFYRAPGKAVCADVIPFYHDGEFKLFYLRDYRDWENFGEGCPWCLLTTKDLVNYVDHGPVLLRGTEEEQDLYVFTGSCTEIDGKFVIYYTGHNPHLRQKGLPEQKILRATSTDLIHWEKDKDFVFEAPDYLEMHDFRDPFVYFDPEKNLYCMLIAARHKNNDPTAFKGVTLIAYSKNGYDWELSKEDFYAPKAYFTHECPDLFKMGDWWYLIFSEFTDKILTKYRMAKSPNGPWITPKCDDFDGHAFYAAKSTTDGKRRILFGWNCIKDKEEDNNFWQWGGNIIAHEIVQNQDGTLSVKCPDEVKCEYSKKLDKKETFTMGDVKKVEETYTLGGEGKNIQMFDQMPQKGKIEITFETDDERGDFGVILRSDNHLDRHYLVKIEPKHNRLTMDKQPRKDGTIHFMLDVERYFVPAKGQNKMTIIFEDSLLEVYINDQVAMSGRMFDVKVGEWGIYSHCSKVKFTSVEIYTK